jgi:hypothetical protein
MRKSESLCNTLKEIPMLKSYDGRSKHGALGRNEEQQ